MASRKILIAGAGIGGLATASCLLKRGFDVEVYEQAPALSEVGAGIQISANAMHVLRDLDVADAIARVGVQPKAYVFRLHDTGEVIQTFALSAEHERRHGAPYIQLHRADLHDLLVAKVRQLKRDAVHLNHRVIGFSERADGVELRFAHDGVSVRGDALVGADGLKSVVRGQIVGNAPPTYTGDGVWRVTVPIERIPHGLRLDQVMSVFMGPGGHAVCYYLRGGSLLNFAGTVEAEVSEESWTLKFPWENLKEDFAGWHPAIQAIIDAADKDECYRWSLHNRPPLRHWSSQRATILGDAAHPTLPYLAQGAAMAIEDGAVLARSLSGAGSVPQALELYQRNRVERTARVVEQSNENQKLFHLRSVEEIRRQFAHRDQGVDRDRWLYSYNPLTVELT
jgi:salicylate hydroxylase